MADAHPAKKARMTCPMGFESAVKDSIINMKANACPMAIRLAWHSSGTFDKGDGTGGSNGATMRYPVEAGDGANAGLSIMRDMLHPMKEKFPDVSISDTWTFAGAKAVEFMGGPKIEHAFGRVDAASEGACPPNGRLPDGALGAEHLRDIFYRQGFNDQEIVALSGAHTVGRCHLARSGFDGPWTTQPLKFDNEYFRNLLDLEWKESKRAGDKPQFEDVATGKLMMLPTDMALKTDPSFLKWVEVYAKNEERFFADFATAYAKLLSQGCPAHVQPTGEAAPTDNKNAEFREQAMHGSLAAVTALAEAGVDANEVEAATGRTALHKAAFWGHDHLMSVLVDKCKVEVNTQDLAGDTALHDAARFGHLDVVTALLKAGADPKITNKKGENAAATAAAYEKPDVVRVLQASM